MTKRILVVGAGAVGSYISGWLAHEGHEVTVLDPWAEHVAAVNERGLSVSGPHEPFTIKLDMLNLHEAQRLARRPAFDIGLICVKSFDTPWAATLAARFIGSDGFLVSAQNCWNDPALAKVVGAERAVGLVMSSIQVALYEPGIVARGGKQRRRDSDYDVFRAGEHDGRVSKRLRKLVDMLEVIDGARVTDNLWGERWAKLCQNCMGNPVTAISGLGSSGLADSPRGRELQIRLASESARVGLALGYRVPPFGGFDAKVWSDASDGHIYEEIYNSMAGKAGGDDWRPSMAQDAYKGRPTEIDEMNGYVLARAGEAGERAPVTAAIVDAVQRFERGEIGQDPAHLDRILKAAGF